MSDQIKHECGIALIRLLKPLDFYQKKYGSKSYGVNKMYLMMEKQHNRGQDGAGFATVKIGAKPGQKYITEKDPQENSLYKMFFLELTNEYSPQKKTLMTILFTENYYLGMLGMEHLERTILKVFTLF